MCFNINIFNLCFSPNKANKLANNSNNNNTNTINSAAANTAGRINSNISLVKEKEAIPVSPSQQTGQHTDLKSSSSILSEYNLRSPNFTSFSQSEKVALNSFEDKLSIGPSSYSLSVSPSSSANSFAKRNNQLFDSNIYTFKKPKKSNKFLSKLLPSPGIVTSTAGINLAAINKNRHLFVQEENFR
jgi:hypothetical protein